jgi:FkbM family methyltransferase
MDFTPVGSFLDTGGGGAWLSYMLTHNMPKIVADLQRNLDEKSLALIDSLFQQTAILPKNWLGNYMVRRKYIDAFHRPEELESQKIYKMNLPQYRTDFVLDEDERTCEAFTYHTGLKGKNDKIKQYISGKDFIDGGSYIGDTALVYLKYYAPRCVYSFDISERVRMRYEKVMHMNNISPDKYKFCPMGLSDHRHKILIDDLGSPSSSIAFRGTSEAQLTDLDSFVSANKLRVGFIKGDLEGAMVEALKGMTETIKMHRPVLSLSIYHSPQEFFETKPLLDEITKDLSYKISIEKYCPYAMWAAEISIFAYPKELDND